MNLAILTTLIIVTYGGDVKVTEGLSDEACRQASCVAEHGVSCEEQKAREAEEMRRYDEASRIEDERHRAWAMTHPAEMAQCKAEDAKQTAPSLSVIINGDCYQRNHPISTNLYATAVHWTSPESPKFLRCVRPIPSE